MVSLNCMSVWEARKVISLGFTHHNKYLRGVPLGKLPQLAIPCKTIDFHKVLHILQLATVIGLALICGSVA